MRNRNKRFILGIGKVSLSLYENENEGVVRVCKAGVGVWCGDCAGV